MKWMACLLGAMLLTPGAATAGRIKLVKAGDQVVKKDHGPPDRNGYRKTVRFQSLLATFPDGTQRNVLVRDPFQGQNGPGDVGSVKRLNDRGHVLGMKAKGGKYAVSPTGMERRVIRSLLKIKPDTQQVAVYGWKPRAGKRHVSLDIYDSEGILTDKADSTIDLKTGRVGKIKMRKHLPTPSNRTN